MSFTYHGRGVILVGDKTTHGGVVITGAETVRWHDIPIACIGDKVTCPLCGGEQTIVQGAETATWMGKNIATHGDKVSCGATLISRFTDTETPYAEVSFQEGDKKSAEVPYVYYLDKESYHFNILADIRTEGVGINGSYSISGSVIVHGTELLISAMLSTAASFNYRIHPWASAKIRDYSGKILETKKFIRSNKAEIWPDDQRIPVGIVNFSLPAPQRDQPLELHLDGGYILSDNTGSAPSMKLPFVNKERKIIIQVKEKEK